MSHGRPSAPHRTLPHHRSPWTSDGPVTGVKEDYVLICKATDELSNSGTLTDSTLQDLLKRHGEVITRKLVLMIGWFNLLSIFLNGCRVPMEVTEKIGTKTSPLG